ncbi:MAG: hypothetical protein ACHRXM_36165 [Isosphaerales bacterium]
MENMQDPPWGKSYVIRPVGANIAFEASADTSANIRALAAENNLDETDLVKLGLALAEIFTQAKRDGHRLAIVDRAGKVVRDVARPRE